MLMRQTLKDGLALKLSTSGSAVQDAIVNKMYDDELAKRTEATSKVVIRIDGIDAELAGIKAKPSGFNEGGEAQGVMYSPQDFQKRKKLQEERNKLEEALADAITNSNFDKVTKEANALKSPSASPSEGK